MRAVNHVFSVIMHVHKFNVPAKVAAARDRESRGKGGDENEKGNLGTYGLTHDTLALNSEIWFVR